jgi:metallo-beta-lactamase family protein
LTHAHIDHIGLIPRLVREGFQGPIYCTRATSELADIMLRDAAKIQAEDAAYKKRRHKKEGRSGKHPELPLFDEDDVALAMPLFRGMPYQKPLTINDHVTFRFEEAGHILGSAMIDLTVNPNGNSRRLIFSGDIGLWGKPLVRDPTRFETADYVVMESTYGDRDHEDGGDVATQLADVINSTVQAGGNIVVPTFAVERAQELMYYISRLVHDDRIPDIKVFLDSPMAVDVTEVFHQHRDAFDEETWQLIVAGESPLHFPGLTMAQTTDQSKAISRWKEPAVIMSTSGMCTAGRIKHHLRHNIGRAESTVVFVGYQGRGTLGRQILEGNKEVRIHGRSWPVRARIEQIYGFSGHADRAALLHWLRGFKQPPRQIFLTHGEQQAAMALSKTIQSKFGWDVTVPQYLDEVDLNGVA